MRRLLSFVAALFMLIGIFTGTAAADFAQDQRLCVNSPNPDERIAACTRQIRSGRRTGHDLALSYNNRGFGYNSKGDYERAIADFNEAIRLSPSFAIAYNNRGLAYSNTRDLDRAIADLDEAIRLDPKLAIAYNTRGLAYRNKRDYDRAIADYSEAIRLYPNYVFAYHNRGVAHNDKGDYDRAIADHSEAIRIDPKFVNAHHNRGHALSNKGDYDRAIADFTEAIRLDPKLAPPYSRRGFAFLAKGDYDRAIADATEAIRRDPKLAHAYDHRCFAFLVKGDFDRAIADATEAIRLDAKFANAYSCRGFASGRKGDFGRAMEDLNRGIELDPKSGVGHGARGLIYEAIGELAPALADLRMALSLGLPLALAKSEAADGVRRIEQKLAAARTAKIAPAASPAAPVPPAADVPKVAIPAPSVTPTPKIAPPVVTTPTTETGRRVALVIGNGNYRHASVLQNPGNDAADIAQALRELGFDVVEGSDLDWAGIHGKVREFARKLDDAAMAFFFYAGHGVQVDGRNYLVPVDAKLDRAGTLDQDAVDVLSILRPMEAEKRINLVFLDACRDNPFTRSLARSLGASRSSAVGQGLAAIQKASGTLITYATEPGNTAADGDGRNSPFTAALLKHIRKPGIEIEQMMKLVRLDVMAATREKQLPKTDSGLLTEVFLKRAP